VPQPLGDRVGKLLFVFDYQYAQRVFRMKCGVATMTSPRCG